MQPAARFDAEWLALREPVDAAARAGGLVAPFARALVEGTCRDAPLRILDVGAGTGANFRYLAPRIAAVVRRDQHWRLLDADGDLLRRSSAAIASWAEAQGWSVQETGRTLTVATAECTWRVETEAVDLAGGLSEEPLVPGEGVSMAAVLDLVSAEWIGDLSNWLAARRTPVLAALSYDGRLDWTPRDTEDAAVRARFNAHQRRDKGFGPALGPMAASRLLARLNAHGYRTASSRSDWNLSRADAEIQARLIATVGEAAAEQAGGEAAPIRSWLDRRMGQIGEGVLATAVGHLDIVGT